MTYDPRPGLEQRAAEALCRMRGVDPDAVTLWPGEERPKPTMLGGGGPRKNWERELLTVGIVLAETDAVHPLPFPGIKPGTQVLLLVGRGPDERRVVARWNQMLDCWTSDEAPYGIPEEEEEVVGYQLLPRSEEEKRRKTWPVEIGR